MNIFWKFVIGIGLAASVAITARAEVSDKVAADLLSKSVVELRDNGDTFCTAAKVGDGLYLTAKHCTLSLNDKSNVYNGRVMKNIVSVDVAVGAGHDWAIVKTQGDFEDKKSLDVGCKEEPYMGQPISYMGYPSPLGMTYGTGVVTHVPEKQPFKIGRITIGSDFFMDTAAAPGASGSPVISRDTGAVIGILVEGIPSRVGFFMIGTQTIKNTSLCAEGKVAEEAPATLFPYAF